MGFVVDGREISVTQDGLIHLEDLFMGALGVDREEAAGELRGMIREGTFPDVRCFKRNGIVLVTSGGAEDVLARLHKEGRNPRAGAGAAMRCFMSQKGPFAPRIREGTAQIPASEACPGEWLFLDMPDTAEQQPQQQPLPRHRVRLTDLELDQLQAATETQAREAQREHFARVLAWYREICEDTVLDPGASDLFKAALMDMLPARGRVQTDRGAREAWRRGVHASLD